MIILANKEIYRLDIKVGVNGDSEAKSKLTAMEKMTQQIEKKTKALNKLNVSPSAKLNDQASSKLDRLESKAAKLKDTNMTLTAKLRDEASGATEKIQKKTDKLKDSNPTVKIKAKDEASSTIDKIEAKASSMGNTLSTRVTLPIVGVGIAAGKIGMDFESGMSRVKAISGATGSEIKQLHDQALQLGADTAFSAKQAAEGLENLASSGFSTQEMMAAMPGLLDLAASSGESLASSSDIAASTLRGFGLAASDAGHVADVLAKNAAATNAAVGDTGEAMKYIAPVAQTAGWSLESVAASIGELANSGIKGSQAGTILRATFSRLAKPSDESAKAMKAMGFSAYDSQHKMKSLSTIVGDLQKSTAKMTDEQKQNTIAQIFGEEAMSGVLTLIKNGPQALDDLTQSYVSSDGAAKEMAKTMQDNAKSSIEQMMGSLETAAIKLEETFAPKIRDAANYVQDLANKFSALSPEQQDFYIKLALGAAALGPAIKLFGGLMKVGRGITTLFGGVAKIIGTTATAETAMAGGSSVAAEGATGLIGVLGGLGPVGWAAVAAVAALGVGVIGVKTHNDLMAKSFDTSTDDLSTWQKVINTLTGSTIKSKKELVDAGLAYEEFSDDLSGDFKKSVEEASKSFNKLKMTLAFDSREGVNFSDSMSSNIKSQIDSIVKSAKDAVMNKRTEMQSTLSQLFNLGDGRIDDNESKVLDNIASYQDGKFNTIQTLNQNIYDVLNKAVSEHRKLTEEDIDNIKNWTRQIQVLELDSSTDNEADKKYASNEGKYDKRLSSMTADEALSATKDAYNNIIDINQEAEDKQRDLISKAKSLSKQYDEDRKKALDSGDTEKAKSIQQDIETINDKVTEAQDNLNNSVKERQEKTTALWDAFYKVNPNMKGHINEINFTKFKPEDETTNKKLEAMKSQYSAVAKATESGMVRVQDATGKWHDIEVTVDQATGNVTSAYDTFTGEYAGYSKEFEHNAKESGTKTMDAMENLKKSLMFNGGGVKLDGNNAMNATTGSTIQKLDTIIDKANGSKVALADINGAQVKMEFDKDGTLTNAQEVEDAINGKLKDNPAVVNVDVNNKDALTKFTETENAADEATKSKTVVLTADNETAINGINKVNIELDGIDRRVVTATINMALTGAGAVETGIASAAIGAIGHVPTYHKDTGTWYARGTNNAKTGVATVAEEGYEIVFGKQKRWFNGGEKVLNHQQSKEFLQNQQSNEPFQVKQGQYQVVQPQMQVAGSGGVSVGDISVNVNGNQDTNGIVQEVVQVVGYKLKEALTNIKK